MILGDRPVLSPVENFYQRALAGDADEAEEQAEQLLKERSLSSDDDEVALKGLQLAADDIRRGVLTPVQLERIHEVIVELAEDLEEYDDVDPLPGGSIKDVIAPPSMERDLPSKPAPSTTAPNYADRPKEWQGKSPVLCIAGRSALDELVSVMLASLLGKHGLGARVVSPEAVSRTAIDRLDTTDVAMTCVSYLNSRGTMAPLRHLLRRLRQRAPTISIVVGLWSPGQPILEATATVRWVPTTAWRRFGMRSRFASRRSGRPVRRRSCRSPHRRRPPDSSDLRITAAIGMQE